MHTRRFGALIIGMWLMGTVLVWYLSSQSAMQVERFFATPPLQVQKELSDMGPEVSRQLVRYQVTEMSRRVHETWEIVQLGLLGALLATSVLNAHRSRIVITAAVLMTLMVALQAVRVTPTMNALSRSYDFLPSTAGLGERQSFASYQFLFTALEVLKALLAVGIISRLMFDFYDFGTIDLPWSKAPKRKRRRRTLPASGVTGSAAPEAHPGQSSRTALPQPPRSAEATTPPVQPAT